MPARLPVILQHEANECALACLAMILSHFGHGIRLDELRSQNSSPGPMSLQALAQLAERHGLLARAVRCECADLRKAVGPLVLHFDFSHFVVLASARRTGHSIVDPARGRITLSDAQLRQRFTGVALELQPGPDFRQRDIKAPSALGTLLRHLDPGHIATPVAGLVLLALCIQVCALLTPFFLQLTVDEVLIPRNTDLALVLLAGFAAVYLLSAAVQWLRGLLAIRLASHLSYLLAASLIQKLFRLSPGFFQRRSIGDIVSRFGSLRPVQEFITDHAAAMLLDLLMMLGTLIMLTAYLPQAAMFNVMLLCFFLCLQYLLTSVYRQHYHEFLAVDAASQSHFVESVQLMDTICRFGRQSRRCQDWLNLVSDALNAFVRAGKIKLVTNIARYLMSGAILLGVAYLAIDEVIAAQLTLGMLYAMMTYASHFTTAALSFSQAWQSLLLLSIHGQRLEDITGAEIDGRTAIESSQLAPEIEFRSVCFSYQRQGRPLIDQLNLQVRDNANVVITGDSGAGKSTLLALILGDHRVTSGEIMVNRRPLSAGLSARSVTSSLLARDCLLQATVMDNITFLDPTPDQQSAARAARLSCIEDDILKLPLGWQQVLGEHHMQLSAGQRQRLLIARAVYRNRGILLLDEATNHLDPELELTVMKNLLSEPGICFFVTHSPAIARLADLQITLGSKGTITTVLSH